MAVWNALGGELDWAGIPLLAAIHGIDDIETLVRWLTAIRDRMRANARNGD